MGMCKCPKKQLTPLFCYEHRVNVCEYCLVTSHLKCIVQSYIEWLQDFDYDPNCTLCSGVLENADCVRLTCLHVFHWSCLDRYARGLPSTTAPAGYTCPTCHSCIFPKSNLVSPVVDVLKEKLVSVNWARAGLDLPLLSNDAEQKPAQEAQSKVSSLETLIYQNHVSAPSIATARTSSSVNSSSTHLNNLHSNNIKQGPPYSVVNIESSHQSDRRVFEAYDDPKGVTFDHDENKYQRKSAFEWFWRWWKLISRPPARKRNSSGTLYKRYAVMFIAGLLFFTFIIILFSWLGRMHSDSDPDFDVLGNPNLNIKEQGI